jgi:hypothetical protein
VRQKAHARFVGSGRAERLRLPDAASHAMTQPTAKMTVDLASPPDREQLVAQISYDREQWAEIHQHMGGLTLELYPRQDGKPWEFPFDEAVTALRHAQKRLTGDDTPAD